MFEWCRPGSLAEALDLLATDGAIALGGGTATALLLKQGLLSPARVVWLRHVPELQGIRGLQLGGGCTLAEIAHDPGVRAAYPALAACAAGVGNVRIRAVATLGGALAHADPAQDLPPMLAALGAEAVLAGPGGERRLPVGDLFTGYMETAIAPGELIVRVQLPPPGPGTRATYVKFTPRSRDDYATVGVACRVELDAGGICTDAAVALAGVGPTPLRPDGVREALAGKRPDAHDLEAAATAAATTIDPWDDFRGSAAYKRAMTEVWVRRALEGLLT